jgi:hypothetical protein
MKSKLIQLATASVLLSVAAAAHANTKANDIHFALSWDIGDGTVVNTLQSDGTVTATIGNTIYGGGKEDLTASGKSNWGKAAHEGATASKLWWGRPSYTQLSQEYDGYTLKIKNSKHVEHSNLDPKDYYRTLQSTNLLLDYQVQLVDGTYSSWFQNSFAVTYNETPGKNTPDIFTIEDFTIPWQVEINGGIYEISLFNDKPKNLKKWDDFVSDGAGKLSITLGEQPAATVSEQYGYLHFGLNTRYVGAVPEPETYAMLLAGLGIVGVVARRRRSMIRS